MTICTVPYSVLVWEEIPENTKFYFIPDSEIDERLRKVLDRAHQQLINCTEESDGAEVLFHLLDKKYPPCGGAAETLMDWDDSWSGKFEGYQSILPRGRLSHTHDVHLTHLYFSGTMM